MSDDDLATIHPLHPDPVVHEAEVVSEEEYQRLTSHQGQAVERWRGYRADAIVVAKATRTVATHQHTRATAKLVGRHLLYVPAGGWVIWRRWRESHTNVRYDRYIRAAETCANWDNVKEWDSRATAERQRRHTRVMDWIRAPFELVKAVVVLLVSVVVALLGLGVLLAVTTSDPSLIVAPVRAVAQVIAWSVWAVTIVWGPLVLAAPWLVLAGLWWLGKQHAPPPAWLAPESARKGNHITPARVVLAFRDLGIAKLERAIKEAADGAAMMLSPIRIAGCGVELDVTLPSGVSTLEVLGKRRRLAENLGRHEHELHPSVAPEPRTVRLWVADSGSLDQPIGPSPLVLDDTLRADFYTGRAPWGEDLRGDSAELPLHQRHVLITGDSNQGKTAAARALALWVIRDRFPELRIADLKGIGDWHMFAGIATTLIEGPADEHVIAATEMLEDGVREMQARLERLDPVKYPDGVTRELARTPGSGFHPLVLIVDEAQQAFMCPAKDAAGRPYGGKKDTSRYFMAARKIHNQGRAVNVTLWQGTQDPTDQNLPKLVREGAHIRACLAIGTEEQAKMALGAKAVDAGAAPHHLRPGLDKGTLVVAGDGVKLAPGQASVTIRTHFIDGATATRLADAARAARGPVADATDQEPRDLLEDVLDVLGDDDVVRATSVADRLRERINHRDYRHINGTELADRLRALGVEVKKNGVYVIRWDRVQAAIDWRDRQS